MPDWLLPLRNAFLASLLSLGLKTGTVRKNHVPAIDWLCAEAGRRGLTGPDGVDEATLAHVLREALPATLSAPRHRSRIWTVTIELARKGCGADLRQTFLGQLSFTDSAVLRQHSIQRRNQFLQTTGMKSRTPVRPGLPGSKVRDLPHLTRPSSPRPRSRTALSCIPPLRTQEIA